MKLINKIIAVAIVILSIFSFNISVNAYDPLQGSCTGKANDESGLCKNNRSEAKKGNRILGRDGILTKIAQAIVFITGAVSVIMIIIGGFRYVLSAGDSNATKGAKDTIMYALIGLFVAMTAQVIVSFVLQRL